MLPCMHMCFDVRLDAEATQSAQEQYCHSAVSTSISPCCPQTMQYTSHLPTKKFTSPLSAPQAAEQESSAGGAPLRDEIMLFVLEAMKIDHHWSSLKQDGDTRRRILAPAVALADFRRKASRLHAEQIKEPLQASNAHWPTVYCQLGGLDDLERYLAWATAHVKVWEAMSRVGVASTTTLMGQSATIPLGGECIAAMPHARAATKSEAPGRCTTHNQRMLQ